MRIFSILIQEAFPKKENKEKAEYWGEQSKHYKYLIDEIKKQYTKIPDRRELAELAVKASKANQAIEELRKITTIDGGENLKNYFHMTYRKQLRASHLNSSSSSSSSHRDNLSARQPLTIQRAVARYVDRPVMLTEM